MADERPELTTAPLDAEAVRGAVIVGVVPDQNPRVVKEAAKYAAMMKAPLVVAHVDVTRFVTYEDPDGYVHSAPIDVNIAPGEADFDLVRASLSQRVLYMVGRDSSSCLLCAYVFRAEEWGTRSNRMQCNFAL